MKNQSTLATAPVSKTFYSDPMPEILHAGQVHWVDDGQGQFWRYLPTSDLSAWEHQGNFSRKQYEVATAEHAALVAVAEAANKLGLKTGDVKNSYAESVLAHSLANLAAVRNQ